MLKSADDFGDSSSHTTAGVNSDISDDPEISTPLPLIFSLLVLFEGGWDDQGVACICE
jgi:hypothetical protein